MAVLSEKIKGYFLWQPLPSMAFQLSSRYISGIHVSQKERKIKKHFILPLEEGVIDPSFYKNNLLNAEELERQMKEGLKKIGSPESKVGFLLPELSQKAFVFSLRSFPSSRQEREQVIRFRVNKQMPMLPSDARIAFSTFFDGKVYRVLVTVARASIVKEYEDIFSRLGMKVKAAGIPSLAMVDLFDRKKNKDLMIVNIEDDSLTMVAVVGSQISLYRQKQLLLESSEDSLQNSLENIIQEIEKTVQFVEDKDKGKFQTLWIRLGVLNVTGELFSELEDKLKFSLKGIESILAFRLSPPEKKMLSPLIGQCL